MESRAGRRTAVGRRELTRSEENSMLWTIIVILLVLWLLGLIGGIGGNLIYLLLVIAAIVLLFQLLSGRRSV
jgi:4-hydroxybenzoate polyprenyltransferase